MFNIVIIIDEYFWGFLLLFFKVYYLILKVVINEERGILGIYVLRVGVDVYKFVDFYGREWRIVGFDEI